ncbi:lacZ [Symbiodinium natans]|uniref:LacZ protein n=1 Tax=Symbiodinium natans TaxID=878477 RepID=A0A812IYU4_9DINO|nr:lacZ [Symbiodinium natans]
MALTRMRFSIRASDAKHPLVTPDTWEGEIIVPFCLQSPLSGALACLSVKRRTALGLHPPPLAPGLAKKYELWYRRCLQLPRTWREAAGRKRVLLHIGACDYTCVVLVNGVAVGKPHVGGSTAFEYDITDALSGAQEDEVLIKCTDHEETDGKAMEPRGKQLVSSAYRGQGPHVPTLYSNITGLWQSVWIELVGPRYLRRVHCAPRADQEMVDWSLEMRPELAPGTSSAGLVVEAVLFLDVHRKVPLARAVGNLASALFLQVPRGWARLWSPSRPYLYGLKYRLFDRGILVDEVTSYTALRVVAVRGDEILLNGRPLFLRLVLDQGYYPDGLWTAKRQGPCMGDSWDLYTFDWVKKYHEYAGVGLDLAGPFGFNLPNLVLGWHFLFVFLYDVEHEKNGLLLYDRRPKLPQSALKAVSGKPPTTLSVFLAGKSEVFDGRMQTGTMSWQKLVISLEVTTLECQAKFLIVSFNTVASGADWRSALDILLAAAEAQLRRSVVGENAALTASGVGLGWRYLVGAGISLVSSQLDDAGDGGESCCLFAGHYQLQRPPQRAGSRWGPEEGARAPGPDAAAQAATQRHLLRERGKRVQSRHLVGFLLVAASGAGGAGHTG